ncbi:MAG: hypothetical protein SFT81_08155 [Candidatus Caenarcaniphilales bacterium]|nr:hypothetical protein [Candidatus Caenarcaniphilales bacterium]
MNFTDQEMNDLEAELYKQDFESLSKISTEICPHAQGANDRRNP